MRRASPVAAAAVLIAARVAAAQNVVDQSQPVFNSQLAFSSTNPNWVGQSFTPGSSNLSGVGFHFTRLSGVVQTGAVEYRVYDRLPTAAGATLLVSATSDSFANTALRQYADVFFTPVAVTVGASYYVIARSTLTNLGVDGTPPASLYASGNAFLYAGGVLAPASFNDWPTYDLTFRTYTAASEAVVPEPSAFVLVAAGLAGAAGAAGARRRA